MARKSVVIDDVMAVVSNQKTLLIANQKEKITIPRDVSPTGKQRTLTFDVSDEGKDRLDKLASTREKAIERAERAYEKAIESAWKDTLDLVAKIEGEDKKKPETPAEPEEEAVELPSESVESPPSESAEQNPEPQRWNNGW